MSYRSSSLLLMRKQPALRHVMLGTEWCEYKYVCMVLGMQTLQLLQASTWSCCTGSAAVSHPKKIPSLGKLHLATE